MIEPIPQTDPRASYHEYKPAIDQALGAVLERGSYILADEVSAFESEFAGYIGAGFGVGVANGTDALELALKAVGVGPGDSVATVSLTATATASAIVACGAVPRFIDVDQSCTMDPQALHDELTRSLAPNASRVRAIVPVHLYGNPADIESISSIAERFGIPVVEDCAQCHGASVHGRRLGSWGRLAAFSFYPTKNLGAFGDGGMVVTSDPELAGQCRRIRQYGWDHTRVSLQPGRNSRLDEMQAAILRVKLRHLDRDNDRRRAIAGRYDAALRGSTAQLIGSGAGAEQVFHQYVIRCAGRDVVAASLQGSGIGTAVHYRVAVHQQPSFAAYVSGDARLSETARAADEVLSLPMYPQLGDDQVDRVIQELRTSLAS